MEKLIIGARTLHLRRVVAEYYVTPAWPFPLPYVCFRVLDRGGDFQCLPDLAIRHPLTGSHEYISGSGHTIETALNDAVTRFVEELEGHEAVAEVTEQLFVRREYW